MGGEQFSGTGGVEAAAQQQRGLLDRISSLLERVLRDVLTDTRYAHDRALGPCSERVVGDSAVSAVESLPVGHSEACTRKIKPLAHPPEPGYPCCVSALGELAWMTPREEPSPLYRYDREVVADL